MTKTYSIKETAEIFNITKNKLRFYEKKGLLSPRRDAENNYRYYNEEDIIKLQTILTYRILNMSIEDIRDLMKNSGKENIIDHFYSQWKVVNDEMHKMRLLKESIEEIMDSVYDNTDGLYTGDIVDIVQRNNKVYKIKDSWKDRWNFNSWAKNYDRDVSIDRSAIKIYKNYDSVLDTACEFAVGGIGRNAEVLDIGIGTGNLADRIQRRGCRVTGIDQSREMLNIVKGKLPHIKVRLGEFLKIPFENGTFDVIVSTYAFHHLTDDEKSVAIEEMLRVLKRDGKIVIGDMMFENQASRRDILSSASEVQRIEIEDEYYSDIQMLDAEFKKHGKKLKVKKIDYLMYVVSAE